MEKKNIVVKKSFPIASILTIIFITLKLAEIGQVATWSWWWIFSPLWISWGLVIFLILLALLIDSLIN